MIKLPIKTLRAGAVDIKPFLSNARPGTGTREILFSRNKANL